MVQCKKVLIALSFSRFLLVQFKEAGVESFRRDRSLLGCEKKYRMAPGPAGKCIKASM